MLNHRATRAPADVIRTVKRWLSRRCHDSRGKTLKNSEQTVNTEKKLTFAFHRNCLILLGKLPLRQIVIKLFKWLLTEGLVFIKQREPIRARSLFLRHGENSALGLPSAHQFKTGADCCPAHDKDTTVLKDAKVWARWSVGTHYGCLGHPEFLIQ